MNVLRVIGTGLIVCVLAAESRAGEENDIPQRVIGTWKVVKASPGTFPLGTVLDLSKDNTVKVIRSQGGKDSIHAGTYKLDGATIVITVKVDGQDQEHTLTVTKISDTDMATDHGGGGSIEFAKDK